MNRRTFLGALLATPVVAALAPLLPKVAPKSLPAVITSPVYSLKPVQTVRMLLGFSWIGGSEMAVSALRVNGVPIMKAVIAPRDYGMFHLDHPVVLRDHDTVSVTLDVPQALSAVTLPAIQWVEASQ